MSYKLDYYFLHIVLLVSILVFIITIFCTIIIYISQNKKVLMTMKNMKMKNNSLQKVCTKNCTCFDDIIKLEDIDFDISIDEMSHEHILILI